MQQPKFSDQGYERDDQVFNHVDLNTLTDRSSCELSRKCRLPQAIGNGQDDNITSFALVDRETGSKLVIPKGSIISKVEICSKKALGDDVEIYLGYFCDVVRSADGKGALLQRICGASNPVTGPLLNRHKRVRFRLNLCIQLPFKLKILCCKMKNKEKMLFKENSHLTLDLIMPLLVNVKICPQPSLSSLGQLTKILLNFALPFPTIVKQISKKKIIVM